MYRGELSGNGSGGETINSSDTIRQMQATTQAWEDVTARLKEILIGIQGINGSMKGIKTTQDAGNKIIDNIKK